MLFEKVVMKDSFQILFQKNPRRRMVLTLKRRKRHLFLNLATNPPRFRQRIRENLLLSLCQYSDSKNHLKLRRNHYHHLEVEETCLVEASSVRNQIHEMRNLLHLPFLLALLQDQSLLHQLLVLVRRIRQLCLRCSVTHQNRHGYKNQSKLRQQAPLRQVLQTKMRRIHQ